MLLKWRGVLVRMRKSATGKIQKIKYVTCGLLPDANFRIMQNYEHFELLDICVSK